MAQGSRDFWHARRLSEDLEFGSCSAELASFRHYVTGYSHHFATQHTSSPWRCAEAWVPMLYSTAGLKSLLANAEHSAITADARAIGLVR